MKIVIATGGSGGHLFPALKVAKELRKDRHEIFFLGSFRVGRKYIEEAGFPFRELDVRGLNWADGLGSLKSIFLFTMAVIGSGQFLRGYKPDVVAGFGGYGAFAVVLAAVLMRYPALIHEQNVIPGRANRILSYFVRKIAVSFPDSRCYWGRKKTVLTGCPSRVPQEGMDRKEALKAFGLQEGRKTILIFGGSQGSRRINTEFKKTAELLRRETDFQVIHICGAKDYDKLKESYRRMGIAFALFEFLDKMEHAYTAADIVIARAGAVSVTEIAKFQRPAVFIPYPYAGGHQKKNAEVLSAVNLARVIEEKDLCAEGLKNMVLSMLGQSLGAEKWAEILKDVVPCDASRRLAQEIENLP